jgi:MAE_28990/MAE_18760-like HEPN
MAKLDLDEFRAEIEIDRSWRENEIRFFKNQFQIIASEEEKKIARKALITLLYSHFEGLCKKIFEIYISKLNSLELKVSELHPRLGASAMTTIFHSLYDTNKKCDEFPKPLPDDFSLHKMAREGDFLEYYWNVNEKIGYLDDEDIVRTESNLNVDVMRKLLFKIGLNPDGVIPWRDVIHKLVGFRNAISHGSRKDGFNQEEYEKLEEAVFCVIDDVIGVISDSITNEKYLKT